MTIRAARLLAPLLAALLGSCGDGAPALDAAPPGRELRAGDSLLAWLDDMVVLRHAGSALAPDAAAHLDGLLGDDRARPRDWRAEFPASAWRPVDAVPPVDPKALRKLGREARAWSLRPAAGLELPLGRVWLEHAGTRTRPLRRDELTGDRRWADEQTLTLFAWDRAGGRLLAFGLRAPDRVAFGFGRAPEPDLWHWDTPSTDAPTPETARDLLRRVSVDRRHRPALAVTAPSVLALPVDRLRATTLELRVALPPLGATLDAGQLRTAPQLSDGVTFAVELQLPPPDGDAAAAPAPVRLWERRVQPGERWHAARVDLSSAPRDAPFTLRLVTEPGDTPLADHALWAGLRLRGGARRDPARPHLILVDIDTLRADRLGLHGAEHDTSPGLDAWAAREAVVFERARSTSDWTLPATASMLTGLAVSQHGATRIGERLRAAHGSLALRLAAAGYETWARTDGGVVVPENGFAEGFDLFDHDTQVTELGASLAALLERVRARDSERPLFLFVQTYAVHAPFLQDRRFVAADAPVSGPLTEQPLDERVIQQVERAQGRPLDAAQRRYVSDLYDAGVARMDAALTPFLEGLDDALYGEPYALLITSDHGEELFDRGALGHGNSLHRELVHVPFLLRLPDGPRGERRDELVSLLDVAPTLLAAAGLPVPPELPGRVLLRDPASEGPHVAQHRDAGWSIEWNRAKLLTGRIGRARDDGGPLDTAGAPLPPEHPETHALFELDGDPRERRDRAAAEPELAARLAAQLDAWRAAHPPVLEADDAAPPLSPEQLAELTRLGYVQDDG